MSTSTLARVERAQIYISSDGGTTWTPWDGVVTGGSGGTSSTDGASFVANTTTGTPAIGAYQSSVSAVTDGDLAVVGITAQRTLKVTLFDSSGNEQAAGGGTQYTEDAASAANPVGNALILRRRDAPSGETTADGDNVAANATDKGELYVKHLDSVVVVDGGASLTIDAASLPLPTGAATSAKQDTVIGHLDGVETLLGTIDADTSTLAGAVAGSEMQVDVVTSALPSGAATLAEQQSQTTHLATLAGAVRAEDAAHSTGHTGIPALSVRQDTAAALAGTDADYQPLITDASGRLHVNVGNTVTVGSHAVTNAGTFAVQVDGNALTALQLIDDVVHTDDTSTHATGTTKGVGIMAAATPTDGSVGANDIGMVAMTVDRKLHVAVMDALPAGTNAIGKLAANNGVDIGDVDVTSVTPGTAATSLGKAEDAAHSSGDVGVMALGVRAAAPTERSAGPTDGDYVPLGVNAVGALWSSLTPSANGGCSTFMASGSDGSSILVATAQAIKASAGVMYGYYAYNPESSATFVHFYNTAAGSVTVGTTNPLFTIVIPATSAANLALPYGITFSNAGWSCAATTTAGGNTAPATGVSLVVWYK